MVFVNKVLYLGHEKDVPYVKQGSEMSKHCQLDIKLHHVLTNIC